MYSASYRFKLALWLSFTYTCQAPKSDEIKNMFTENLQLQLSNIILHCKVIESIYNASFWL